jgi:Flp pilus assembly protein TadG
MATLSARMRRITGRGVGESGAELIEMAMVTPIFLLLLAGIFDFGLLFRSWEVVTNAAREGARVGVLPAYSADENIRLRVESYMQASGVADACSLSCSTSVCSVCVTNDDFVIAGVGTITTRVVTVQSDQTLPFLSTAAGFFPGSIPETVTVSGSAVMRTEEQAVAP